jgi:transcription initiation factor TFIIB
MEKKDSADKPSNNEFFYKDIAGCTDATEKRYLKALSLIMELCKNLGLTVEVCESSAEILIKLASKTTLRRHSFNALCAVSIYITCRSKGQSISLRHLAYLANISNKKASQEYKFLIKKLKMKPARINTFNLIKKARLKEADEALAGKILGIIYEIKLSKSKNPHGLAAAACYTACISNNGSVTQRELSNTFNLTERTLRSCLREITSNTYICISL